MGTKNVTFNYLRKDTPTRVMRVMGGIGIAFDFDPHSPRKAMTGIVFENPEEAHALAAHCLQIADRLKPKVDDEQAEQNRQEEKRAFQNEMRKG